MENRELIHEETREGFTVRFYTAPEWESPADNIATGDDALDAAWVARIASGELCWFTAIVTASRCGVELGAAYLGCCDYADPRDFVTDNGMFDDMASEAIAEARERIGTLCREAA